MTHLGEACQARKEPHPLPDRPQVTSDQTGAPYLSHKAMKEAGSKFQGDPAPSDSMSGLRLEFEFAPELVAGKQETGTPPLITCVLFTLGSLFCVVSW